MEYMYAAMLLHSAGQKIEEKNLSSVLKAANADVDTARIKALVSALEDVDIEKAITTQAVPTTVAAQPAQEEAKPAEEKKEEKEEEKKEEEEEEIGGLGALFG